MATPRKAAPADDPAAFASSTGAAVPTTFTDCAACHAPLPPGHRYLCAACVADSAERARALLSLVAAGPPVAVEAPAESPDLAESDEVAECPTCGMALDASGRCAVCVTTVRR
jgi:hypothetical protein